MYTSNSPTRFLLFAAILTALAPLAAQQRPFSGAAEIEQSLHKLNELGTVLMIAAHPDDERTAVLAYFARDGHGQHQTSAILGKDAFEAAADPKRFPEQLQYVQPWRTRRLIRANYGPP